VFRIRPAFPGGVVLPPRERRTGELGIRQLPFAPLLYLPLRQGACEPAVALVRAGEEVARGQLLARADNAMSLPLHSPAAGRVVGIVEQPDRRGGTVAVIHLAPFPGDTQEYHGGPGWDPDSAGAASLVDAIRAAGLVGQGGEAKPTHAGLRASAGRVLVLNGIEEEQAFNRVPAILRAQAADVLMGVRYLLKAAGAARAVLAVERQDGEAAQALLAAAPPGLPLALRVLPARYPQGAEALLLRVLADGPPAGAGAWADALCCNLVTVAELGRLLAQGLCMIDQVIALAGDALREPGNYRVPLGTPVRFALAQVGLQSEPCRVLQGGTMRGQALASLDAPITKGMTGLLALDLRAAGPPEPPLPCIRCGECLAVCPMQLHPAQLGLLARKGEINVMHKEYHLDSCFECGCCAYVCPSRIPLVQLFRAAKAQWRRQQPAVAGGSVS
jgi:Na+-translocating ferredoxin:NAD+ oxidoreductase subunit C